MDARDLHAATCDVGGGVIHGHNKIRDWLADWVGEHTTGHTAPTEQFVPAWARPLVDPETQQQVVDAEGKPQFKHAKLDVAFFDGEGRQVYVDVVVTSAATACAQTRAQRASTDGAAAADAVRGKRSKYPAAKSPSTPLVPFAVEALGRLSPEAQGLLNALAPADKKVRSQVLRTAKQTLSVLVQTRLAELLLSAEPGRGCTGPVALAA